MHFDIAVIGAGSGNMIINRKFGDKKVAILEKGPFGGTCLNVGCIPTKMFVYAADVARTVTSASRYGLSAQLAGVDWPAIVRRVFDRIEPNAREARDFREHSPTTEVFHGHATFTGERTLDTGTGQVITADQVVIAAGARPIIPPEVAASPDVASGAATYHTNETIMRLPALPRRLVIVGSGVVACEFAHVFSALGSEVSLIVRGDRLLTHYDDLVTDSFTALAHTKWKIHTHAVIREVAAAGAGVSVRLADGATVDGDTLLVATGRTPNGDLLNLPAAGVRTHPDGRIVVDKHQRTTAPGVWALGDVCAPSQLKHLANHEARVVQHNLLHPRELLGSDHRFVPRAVFTDPQVATVGLTERQARAAGHDVAVVVHRYADVAYGWAMEDTEGFCKIVADKSDGTILGAHIMGAHAPTAIQPLVQAMTFGQTVPEMARGQFWIHPALSEVVENALLALKM